MAVVGGAFDEAVGVSSAGDHPKIVVPGHRGCIAGVSEARCGDSGDVLLDGTVVGVLHPGAPGIGDALQESPVVPGDAADVGRFTVGVGEQAD